MYDGAAPSAAALGRSNFALCGSEAKAVALWCRAIDWFRCIAAGGQAPSEGKHSLL
jgi:hypothetical protein